MFKISSRPNTGLKGNTLALHTPLGGYRSTARHLLATVVAAGWLLATSASHAYLVEITAPPSGLFLQVGAGVGRLNLKTIDSTNARNPGINNVSVTLTLAKLGQGPIAMTTDSNVSTSPIDGFPNYCKAAEHVYIGGFYRTPNPSGGGAALRVSTPTALTSASGERILMNTISWVSSGLWDTDGSPTVPNGSFSGGSQTLSTMPANYWFESCMQFNYANHQTLPPGIYTGQATYSLSAP